MYVSEDQSTHTEASCKNSTPGTASYTSTRHQARTDGGGGEKESSVPELCRLESVCGQACVYRHIARCVFTTIIINQVKAYIFVYRISMF